MSSAPTSGRTTRSFRRTQYRLPGVRAHLSLNVCSCRQNILHVDPLRWIVARVARRAEASRRKSVRRFARGARMRQPDQGQICQRIRLDILANLFETLVGGDQVFLVRRIDAVKAGRDRRWAGDAQMHFRRARGPHHPHDLTRGGSADNGIVDQDHALAFEQRARRIQLHAPRRNLGPAGSAR